jgi:hypothetical protein
MGMIDTFGAKFTVLLALVAFAYLLVALAPILWPAFRAFRRSRRLERPWLFTLTVAALTYGFVYLIAATVAIPIQAYVVFVAPQLQEMGQPYGSWLVAASSFVGQWWWPLLPLAVLASTIWLTRKLAAKWSGICSALAA